MSPSDPARPSLNGWNAAYLDAMHEQWRTDPDSVDPAWRSFFQGFDLGLPQADSGAPALPDAEAMASHTAHTAQGRVDSLIYHYRDIGHLHAKLDPLGSERAKPNTLELDSFGLSEADLDQSFDPGHLPLNSPATLRDIIAHLESTYCGSIGAEYMHIQDRERRRWLQQRMEPVQNQPPFDAELRQRILRDLVNADVFEEFLHTRYRGKKRFGLDGGESLIPMMVELIEQAPGLGIEEFCIGMAHRGRLNVLTNILEKSHDQIFTEFEEAWTEDFAEGGGDVKYHLGYSNTWRTASGQDVHLSLSPNPSHLEFVSSVILGRVRAKQRLRVDPDRIRVVPVAIHGDAAFPGQGVVAECFNMMKLDGYDVGGTIHLVVNNQVGFTTDPEDTFSGRYCTDLAKMVESPILHVNGDDPEACVFAARLALAYRQEFGTDVVIEMWCYRRHGHNEGDEPTFTQPELYERIKNQHRVAKSHAERLVHEGVLTAEAAESMRTARRERLDEAQTRTKDTPVAPGTPGYRNHWSGLTEEWHDEPVETNVPLATLHEVSNGLAKLPANFELHRKLQRLTEARAKAMEDGSQVDWATGELLAFGTLLLEGHAVRLTGQDVQRGTFSHRHAVFVDQNSGEKYCPLDHLREEQGRICVHNSPLTESACLGYEYGYSLTDPRMLILWEAQFGDFANGAQVIIDQFIASAETKWKRSSGLVLMLPHGYEGQGPEHSSARMERFLTLCAGDNMQVVQPSTPAQHFHLLRRQLARDFRRPLIIMTPKSLLRHPKATSVATDFSEGRFHHILPDSAELDHAAVQDLIFCSGKVFYELEQRRSDTGRRDLGILRMEQLHPLREESIRAALAAYPNARRLIWVQDEPKNMGAFRHVEAFFREQLGLELVYVGRRENASPAVGSSRIHAREQHEIMDLAVGRTAEDTADPAAERLVEGPRP